MAFFVIATFYVVLLVLEHLTRVFGGFAQIILTVFLAWLLAFVLAPAVRWVKDRTGLPRGAAVGIVYAATLLVTGSMLFFAGSRIGGQIGELAENFPETRVRIEATLTGWQEAIGLNDFDVDLVELFHDAEEHVARIGSGFLGNVPGLGVTVGGGLVLVLILSLYMVLDTERILGWMKRLVPDRFEDQADLLERSVGRAFGGFLRAQLILAAIQAALTVGVGLAVGLPYLFLIGLLSALAMLIPFFGPPLALVPPILAIAVYAPEWFLVAVPILVLVQTVLVNYLQPRLMQGALGMHPLLVLVGLLVGAQVAGIWGALFGIPVIAVLTVFVNYAVNLATLHDTAEVEVGDVLAEARLEAPDAPMEEVMALAAEKAEDAHEEARDEAADTADVADSVAQKLDITSQELRETSGELRTTSLEARRATEEARDATQEIQSAASDVRETTDELKETIGQAPEPDDRRPTD